MRWSKCFIPTLRESPAGVDGVAARGLLKLTAMVGQVLIFNIAHNRYRLVTTVFFATREIYIKAVLTHKEYERKEWEKWC
jgi:mRNA interferase HigB